MDVRTAGRDVADAVPDARLRNSCGERGLAGLEQPLGLLGDVADRERVGAVGDEAVEGHADVDVDDVALLERVGPRDAVDDDRVRRDAERRGKAAVALRRRDAALARDVLLADPVELGGRHAGPDVLPDEGDRLGDERARGGHLLDLLGGFPDDHATAPACSSACWISAKTSFSLRSPWMPTTLPRVRQYSTS